VRILMWDVHGGYTDSLLGGTHDYLFLRRDESGRGGLARYGSSTPSNAYEVTAEELHDEPPDVVLLQRLEEIELCAERLGRRPGHDLPAIFLEHNTPKADVPSTRHPLADEPSLLVVHVTHFNQLFWDCGRTQTRVIEHGVADPGLRYTGRLPRLAFVVNEPVRRWRVTGTDLLTSFADFDVDAWGIDADLLPDAIRPAHQRVRFAGNLKANQLYDAMAERRVYLHLNRWTSLGLSLIQAMLLGMPVVVLDATEASRAVPDAAGARSSDITELVTAARRLLADPAEAQHRGVIARHAALERYGLPRFLHDWDLAFKEASEIAVRVS
ncbi:MAG TPA: glycosyltransferase, partial [Propionibacteriaceae bacterium]|nr:glycosyltransferase [Propionibacteriaceae bacterium]